jgi:DNA-binding beta-propeller fold protein YncE
VIYNFAHLIRLKYFKDNLRRIIQKEDNMRRTKRAVLVITLMILVSLLFSGISLAAVGSWGVVVNDGDGTISVVDPYGGTVYGPFLGGVLPFGQEMFEVKITPDGNTALIASWSNHTIYFINISVPTSPTLLGQVSLPTVSENLAISPNGRCALIGDGILSTVNGVHVVDIPTRTYLTTVTPPAAAAVNDVAIALDGVNVLVSDAANNLVHLMMLNQNTCQLTDTGTNFPAGNVSNAEFSPDGGTALVTTSWIGNTVYVFRVNGPGSITSMGTLPGICNGPASIAYARFSPQAYIYCVAESPDRLAVLNILGPGNVVDSAIRITLGGDGHNSFYGVNQIAVTSDDLWAIVSHEAGTNTVSRVNLNTLTYAGTLTVGNGAVSVATAYQNECDLRTGQICYASCTPGFCPQSSCSVYVPSLLGGCFSAGQISYCPCTVGHCPPSSCTTFIPGL